MKILPIFMLMILFDYLYLSLIGSKFVEMISIIQKEDIVVKYFSMAICYLLMSTCLAYFIEKKNFTPEDSMIMGILVYGIYELTNYTVFKKWPLDIVFIDTLWGGVLFYTCTYITQKLK